MKNDREKRILDLLSDNGRMEVTKLSAVLGVSQVTIRKDLDRLEEKHMIKRIHGFAEIGSADDINGRLAYHYEEKMKIAAKAAELIHDGDTVMIENGSCCALAASRIAATRNNVTIVTNSAFIADYIRNESVNIVLLGGIYQNDSQCMVGPMVKDCASNYHVQYCFVGTDGWSEKTGFTNKDQMRAQAVRDISSSADKIVILTESEKFSTAGTVPLNIQASSSILITDSYLKEDVRQILISKGIEIIIS